MCEDMGVYVHKEKYKVVHLWKLLVTYVVYANVTLISIGKY